jgi:hypothetical protein
MTEKAPFVPLSDTDRAWLEDARAWVKGHFSDGAEAKYSSLDGKLSVVDAILTNGRVLPNETWKLQALGAAFGDALGQRLLLEWVSVEDEYGATAALNLPGTSLLSFHSRPSPNGSNDRRLWTSAPSSTKRAPACERWPSLGDSSERP